MKNKEEAVRFYLLVVLLAGVHAKLSLLGDHPTWSAAWSVLGVVYAVLFLAAYFDRQVMALVLRLGLAYGRYKARRLMKAEARKESSSA